MAAVENKHEEVVKLLLQNEADSSFGSKAVRHAQATHCHTSIKFIIVCFQVGGGTVLTQALRLGLTKMADLLLRNKVDINACDKVNNSIKTNVSHNNCN